MKSDIQSDQNSQGNMGNSSGGFNLQKLDNKNRIFVSAIMRRYFDFCASEKPICWVGYFSDLITPCLIILSDTIHDKIAEKSREQQLLNYNKLDNLDLDDIYSGYSLFHPVEIRSNRIQLNINDRRILNLPEDDKRIVIAGIGSMFHVWRFDIFKERKPEVAKFLEGDPDAHS